MTVDRGPQPTVGLAGGAGASAHAGRSPRGNREEVRFGDPRVPRTSSPLRSGPPAAAGAVDGVPATLSRPGITAWCVPCNRLRVHVNGVCVVSGWHQ